MSPPDLSKVQNRVEQLSGAVLGSPVAVQTDSRRNFIWRAQDRLSSRSMIVKLYGTSIDFSSRARFLSERSALLMAVGFAPKLLAYDEELLLVVLEDLGSDPDSQRPWTSEALLRAAAVLGSVSNLLVTEPWNGVTRTLGQLPALNTALGELGFHAAPEFVRLLLGASESRCSPSVLSHGDPVRANFHIGVQRDRLLDFEFAEPASPMRDLSWFYMAMPSAAQPWQLSTSLIRSFHDAYARESATLQGLTSAPSELLSCCAFWLLLTLQTHLPLVVAADGFWGATSNRTRIVTRLRLFAELADELGHSILSDEALRLWRHCESRWGKVSELPTIDTQRAARF